MTARGAVLNSVIADDFDEHHILSLRGVLTPRQSPFNSRIVIADDFYGHRILSLRGVFNPAAISLYKYCGGTPNGVPPQY